jgi:hypothetical protein
VQHTDVCWRGRAEAACAALYPRPDEAMDAHEQRIPERMTKTCAPLVRSGRWLDRRTEPTPNPPNWLCLLLITVRGAMAAGCRASAGGRYAPARTVAT